MPVEIEGLSEMRSSLSELGQLIQGEIVFAAVKGGSTVIRNAMVESTPTRIEEHSTTALPPGAVKRDIKVRIKKERDGFDVATIGPRKTAYVARWVEYGHRLILGGGNRVLGGGRTSGTGRQVGDVPEHPFLRQAYERSREEAMSTFTTTMREQIKKRLR